MMTESDKEWILKLVGMIERKMPKECKEIIADANMTGTLDIGSALGYIKITVESSK